MSRRWERLRRRVVDGHGMARNGRYGRLRRRVERCAMEGKGRVGINGSYEGEFENAVMAKEDGYKWSVYEGGL